MKLKFLNYAQLAFQFITSAIQETNFRSIMDQHASYFSFDCCCCCCFIYKSRDLIIFLAYCSCFYQLPQWRPVVLNQRQLYSWAGVGHLAKSGNIFGCHNLEWGDALACRVQGARDAAKYFTSHRTEPNKRELSSPKCQW